MHRRAAPRRSLPLAALAALAALSAACDQAPTYPPSTELTLARAELHLRLLQDVADGLAGSPGLAKRTEEFASGLYRQALTHARQASDPAGHMDVLRRIEAAPGLFNYDNVYHLARIDSGARYLLLGRRAQDAQTTLQFLDGHPADLPKTTMLIGLDDLPVERGRVLRLYLGQAENPENIEPSKGTWRALPKDTRYLFIRETFNDWNQRPGVYSLQPRTEQGRYFQSPTPPAEPPATEAVLRRFIALRDRWAGSLLERLREQAPVNAMRPVAATVGGLRDQYSSSGRFALKPGQALLITLPQGSAGYFSIQLGDEWFVTPRQRPGPVTRNRASSRLHSDGRYRYVVSAKDPGVANWLNSGDIRDGFVFCRWQGDGAAPLDGARVEATLLPDAQIAESLRAAGVDTDRFAPITVTGLSPSLRHYPYLGR